MTPNIRLYGTGVALVTPFNTDLSIDYKSLNKVLDHVSLGGVDYLVILGTTGETSTVTWEEKKEMIHFIIEHNTRNLPLVMGLGGNNTQSIIQGLDQLKHFPFDAILSVSPYYNRPSQQGILHHYQAIADSSPFPIILYNVPARTGSNISAKTTIELSQHRNIIGTKEASGDLVQCAEIHANTPENFLLISGEDSLTLPIISLGGVGAISVIANLQPAPFSSMVREALKGNFSTARNLHEQLLDGYRLMGEEGNPVSVKTGLAVAGLIQNVVRQPLFAGSAELQGRMKAYAARS